MKHLINRALAAGLVCCLNAAPAAAHWYPDLSQEAKLSLAYVGKSVKYKDGCGLEDFNSNRIELSLIYRIKIF